MKKVLIDGVEFVENITITDNYVIVRGDRSGVFAGNISKEEGRECTLLNARRLWYWNGAASLSQLATEGVKKPNDCKFPVELKEIRIKDVIEVIPCTQKAEQSIKNVPVWEIK
jgi:hypothetical protein